MKDFLRYLSLAPVLLILWLSLTATILILILTLLIPSDTLSF